ncbi:SMC-Scp complex subunit ScpB [Bacillus fonticola]|uniref:SMC-Scp complex subunit ScpB n=1 Tax=Bacillus fonticola TaxID=2728853 RepID=UPI001474259D|nr:SMC-Scp complex subunit ScpB [Bacillus fonticola]
MDRKERLAIIEAILFASGDEGVSQKQLAHVLDTTELEISQMLDEMREQLCQSDRGLVLLEMGEIIQLATKKEMAPFLKKLVEAPTNQTLSQAALETLAIIAYKQPITRSEVEEIRGVKSERPVQTLLTKGLVEEKGRREGIGRAYLFGTSPLFLDVFGLKDLNELPPLPEEVGDADVETEADLFFEKFQETLKAVDVEEK